MLVFHEDGKTYKLPVDDADVHITYHPEEGVYFSWQGCANCNDDLGKVLGAEVLDCRVYPSLAHVKAGSYWEKELCQKCLYEHEYGIGSYES